MLAAMELPNRDSELVQIVDAALAAAAHAAGPWLVCKPGCTPCCHGAFAIGALDTLRLQAGMATLHAADPQLAAKVEHRAHQWIQEHGPTYPGNLDTGILGSSDEDREQFEEFANDAACPALDPATGQCDVYPFRPMTCRVFGPPVRMGEGDALGHCELCFHGATEVEVKACEMMVPHDVEAKLLEEIGDGTETIVAFALLHSGH